MNNINKKIVAIVTALTLSVMMAPGLAQGATVEELQTQINTLLATLSTLQSQLATLQGGTTTGVPAACTGITFDRNLQLAMTGNDVKCLQALLNTDAVTQVATTGVGSPGNETTYFGNLTKAAVIKFQEKYAADCLTPLGLTAGTGFVGAKTRVKLNSLLTGGTPVTPVPGVSGLSVALAANTPAATSVVTYGAASKQAQVLVPFVTLNFTAGLQGPVKVTTLKFTRTGIAADSNLDNTYLYEGTAKLVEGGTISSKVVTFNDTDADGIFTVPAGTTKSITLKGNLNSAASAGATIGFNLVAVTDVTSDATAVNGTFPVAGNLMTVATATDLGYVDIGGSYATPASANTTVDPQDDYVVWSFSLQAVNQNVQVERIVFTEVGSILTDDLQNFKLYYGGTVVGTAASMNADRQVILDLSASPLAITKGATKALQLHADIVKGSTRTFAFTFQYPTDIVAKDLNYGVYVGSYETLASGWTLVQPTGNYYVNYGSLTVTKRTDSPTGNVPRDATGVTLAKYDFKAVGEDVKVSNLRISANTSSTAGGLDNGMVYLNGVQVGSTVDLVEYTGSETPTTFNFGNSFIVAAGTTALVEIKADIKTTAAASLTAGETVTAYIRYNASYNNGQGVSSLTVLDIPSSDKAGNALTVQTGALTFTKNIAYGNQSTTAPTTGFRVGSFQMTAGSTEGVNVDSITVTIENSGEAEIENLLLKIGTEQIGSTRVTPSATNLFSVNVALAAGQSKVVNIYADVLSTAAGTIDADGFAVTGTGTTAITSTAANYSGTLELQIVTVATGALAVEIYSGNPDDALVTGLSTDVPMAKYEFASTYEAFTVSEIKVYASSEQDRTAPRYTKSNLPDFLNVWLSYKDSTGATVTTSKISTFVNGMMHFTGLNLYVPANGKSVVTIFADLNAVAATGYALTGDRPQITLAFYKANSGSISSLERHTGVWWYFKENGTPNTTMSWVTSTADTSNDATYKEGTNILRLATAASLTGYYGAELNIPVQDLGLTMADIITGGSITYSAQTSDSNKYGPDISIFLDCDNDGDFDGEIIYNNYTLAAADTWETVTLNSSDSVNWWSNGAVCGANSGGDVALSTFSDTGATIVGLGLAKGYYANSSTASKYYYVDKVIINTSSATYTPYVSEDSLGDFGFGTNYEMYRTKPTVSMVGTTGSLTTGTNTLFTTSIAADSAGDVGLKVITFNVTGNDAAGGDMTLTTLKLWKGSTDYTDKVVIADDIAGTNSYESTGTDLATGSAFPVYVVFTDEEVITAGTSQTYKLTGLTALTATGDSISTYITDDAAPYGQTNAWDIGLGTTYANLSAQEFIWSDRSYGSAHSLTSSDWINGNLVEVLGSANTYTISR